MRSNLLPIVKVEELKAYYVSESYGINSVVKAVDDVSFEIYEDEILGIAGESGCGKTTLLKTLLGTIKPRFLYLEVGYSTE